MRVYNEPSNKHRRQRDRLCREIGTPIHELLVKTNAAVLGGALTSIFSKREIRDFDVYTQRKEGAEELIHALGKLGLKHVYYTDHATSLRSTDRGAKTFQVITVPALWGLDFGFNSILQRFDFTVCQAGYFPAGDLFLFGEYFFEHLAARQLIYNVDGLHPIATLFRVKKYLEKGYSITGVELIKLGLKIHGLQIPDYRTLRDEILGIDLISLKRLTDHLLEPEIAARPFNADEFFQMLELPIADEEDEE